MIKALNQLGIEGNFLVMVKRIYKKPASNIILSDRNDRNAQIRNGAARPTLPTSIQYCVGCSSLCKQEKAKQNKRKTVEVENGS